MNKSDISKYMSSISKAGHKKSPRGKEYYQRMQKLSTVKRKENLQAVSEVVDLEGIK